MKKVCVVTATRAEYGLLYPILKLIEKDTELELQLIVSGTHLSKKYGYTYDEDGGIDR
jgi:GDP/UDP-N,N'-diacetylbacillosamine 2-epimerase (hydrolysing)